MYLVTPFTDRGELKQISFADNTAEFYKFDGNGNQTQRTNGMFQTINYGYDEVDNLTSVTYPSGPGTTFIYDNDGRQTSMVDGTGTSSWLYDNADNVTKLTTPQGVMDYVYDVWNRRTSLKEGTVETTYGFSLQRLTSVSKSTDGVATTLSYDQYGRISTKTDGATRTEYTFDDHDRISTLNHVNTGTSQTFHSETYNYNLDSSLQNKIVNSALTSYTYDEIGQLKTENGGGLNNTYNYDANGNRTSKQYGGNVDTYVYDDADKLTSITKPNGIGTYHYDDCGRVTSVTGPFTKAFTWDYEDRMTSATVYGTTPTNYSYNGVGSRTAKTGPFGNRTYKRNGVGVTAPVLNDGVATMVPGISERSNGVTSTVHADRLGSMKAMSTGGTVTDTAAYDAFGVASHTGPSTTQKGFVGGADYQEDGESSLKLLGHRYYDPEIGRFISRDPAFAGRNWYAYCDNDPVNYVDADGCNAAALAGTGVWEGGTTGVVAAEEGAAAYAGYVGGGGLVGVVGLGGVVVVAAEIGGAAYAGWQIGRYVDEHLGISGALNNAGVGDWLGGNQDELPADPHYAKPWKKNKDGDDGLPNEHKKNARKSTENKHQNARARARRDRRGGEKGDDRRPYGYILPYGLKPQIAKVQDAV